MKRKNIIKIAVSVGFCLAFCFALVGIANFNKPISNDAQDTYEKESAKLNTLEEDVNSESLNSEDADSKSGVNDFGTIVKSNIINKSVSASQQVEQNNSSKTTNNEIDNKEEDAVEETFIVGNNDPQDCAITNAQLNKVSNNLFTGTNADAVYYNTVEEGGVKTLHISSTNISGYTQDNPQTEGYTPKWHEEDTVTGISIENVEKIIIDNEINVEYLNSWFSPAKGQGQYNLPKIKEVVNLNNIKMDKVISATCMFAGLGKKTAVTFTGDKWTSLEMPLVVSTYGMFCESNINCGFDGVIGSTSMSFGSNLKNTAAMFQNARANFADKTLDLTTTDFSNVSQSRYMFNGLNWDLTEKAGIDNLNQLKIGKFNVEGLDARSMFMHCDNLKILDVSQWTETANSSTQFNHTFAGNPSLETIFSGNVDWSAADSGDNNVFTQDNLLVGGNLYINDSTSPKSAATAKVDYNGHNGYFTFKSNAVDPTTETATLKYKKYDQEGYWYNVTQTVPKNTAFTMQNAPSEIGADNFYAWKETGDDHYYSAGSSLNANNNYEVHEVYKSYVTKAPSSKELTYNTSAQELVNAGTVSAGTMLYALGNSSSEEPSSYSTAIPSATNAGTYYVWYKAQIDENHYPVDGSSFVEVAIDKCVLTRTVSMQEKMNLALAIESASTTGILTVTTDKSLSGDNYDFSIISGDGISISVSDNNCLVTPNTAGSVAQVKVSLTNNTDPNYDVQVAEASCDVTVDVFSYGKSASSQNNADNATYYVKQYLGDSNTPMDSWSFKNNVQVGSTVSNVVAIGTPGATTAEESVFPSTSTTAYIKNLSFDEGSQISIINPYGLACANSSDKKIISIDMSNASNLHTLDNYSFRNENGLTSIVLPESIKNINKGSFVYTSITNFDARGTALVNLGSTSDGDGIFEYCTKLKSIYVPSSIEVIGKYLLYQNSKSTTNIYGLENSNLTSIGASSFNSSGITSLNLTGCSKLTSIPSGSFTTSTLKTINLSRCSSLTNFTGAFTASSVTSLNLTGCSKLQTIGSDAFTKTSSTNFTLTGLSDCTALTSIGNNAFNYCNLGSTFKLDLSGCTSLTSIGSSGFANTNLSKDSITLPSSMQSIGQNAFASTPAMSRTDVDIIYDNSNKCILGASSTFSAYRVAVSKNVVCIADYAFSGKTSIKYVVLNADATTSTTTVNTYVGAYAFKGCTDLTTYVVRAPDAYDNTHYSTTPFSGAGSTTNHAKLVIAGGNGTSSAPTSSAGSGSYYTYVWQSTAGNPSMANGKYYQLSQNINSTAAWTVAASADCVLDLNGKTLNRGASSSSQSYVINLNGSCKFRLDDTSVWEPSTLSSSSTAPTSALGKIKGGYYSGAYGGGINCSSGNSQIIDMVNGEITGNTGGQGGGIFLYNSSILNMYGGKIRENKTLGSSSYGAPAVFGKQGCKMNMYDGDISYNTGNFSNKAAAIWLNNASSKFNMYGGYVRHNFWTNGTEGGIYECTKTFTGVTKGTKGNYNSGNYVDDKS